MFFVMGFFVFFKKNPFPSLANLSLSTFLKYEVLEFNLIFVQVKNSSLRELKSIIADNFPVAHKEHVENSSLK